MRRAGSGQEPPGPRFTVVSFHAHPDDEALLTAGTLARAVRDGHRVVLVVATGGEAGSARSSYGEDLAAVRRAELERSAAAIGVSRVVLLGYADSGYDVAAPVARPPADAFSRADPEEVALELAAILRDEGADVLTSYDRAGGYGHPDHLQVHHVGRLAARHAGTPVVLEATVDRDLLLRATRVVRALTLLLPVPRMPDLSSAYTPRSAITHRVDVRSTIHVKRECLRAHASQATADEGDRTLGLLLGLPRWLQARVLRHEWFVETGHARASSPLVDDIFASLR